LETSATHGRRAPRKGFTLPEVIVTISLIAALAAVVVPTIVSQVKKGDPSRVGNDMLAIRGAAEQFLSDVRRYPASVGQVTNAITTSMAPLTTTALANYGSAEVNRWRGPYLSRGDSAAATATGFGLSFVPGFTVDTLPPSGAASTAGGQRYMVLRLLMKDSLSGLEIDKQFDDGVLLTGSIRYLKNATSDTLKFLLMPIY
jgi:prepilin-type N-terminal cleavage/methylation domain-containing protein